MFFAPKEIKTETGESLVYNLHRTMVSKEFTFDAAHHLFNYEGKCKSLHGHTYHLQIAVSGYLDERGMTYDFGDLKNIYKNHLIIQYNMSNAHFVKSYHLMKSSPLKNIQLFIS